MHTSEGVVGAARALRRLLAGFDPSVLAGHDAAAAAEVLAATAKACATAAARAAARAAECGAHRGKGYADPAEWLGRASGSSRGEARDALNTAVGVEECPATKEALVNGDVSLGQAKEIVAAEAAAPGSEHELLGVARRQSLHELKQRARRRRHEAADTHDLHRRQRAARFLRHWRDRLGMVCFSGALAPEDGVALINRLEAEAARLRREAKRRAKTDPDNCPLEPWDAHAADALVNLIGRQAAPPAQTANPDDRDDGHTTGDERTTDDDDDRASDDDRGDNDTTSATGGGGRPAPEPRPGGGAATTGARGSSPWRADLVIVCDLRAWRRGMTYDGELCHIVGGGPIPVTLARDLARDPFLKAVLHDGVAVHTVSHFGRRIPAALRTALDLGAPPDLDGVTCCEQGCDNRLGLEWDHINPVANRGPPELANLAPRCWRHHQDKTERDRATGLLQSRAPSNDPP